MREGRHPNEVLLGEDMVSLGSYTPRAPRSKTELDKCETIPKGVREAKILLLATSATT